MQAIVTKWHGPTNHKGSRVTARCDAGSVTIPWDDALDVMKNHRAAITALVKKLGWPGVWQMGSAPGKGSPHAYVAVCVHMSPEMQTVQS